MDGDAHREGGHEVKRGPKPKPTALKLAQGNAGHRPLNKEEPKAPNGLPQWPTEIKDKTAQQRWFSLIPELEEMGVVSKIDRDALVMYCLCYSKLVRAHKKMEKADLIVNIGGSPQHHPYLSVINKAIEQLRKLGAEFGLTPSSRSGLHVLPKAGEKTGLAKLMGETG